MADGRALKEIPLTEWIHAPIVGRITAGRVPQQPAWVDDVDEKSVPPLFSLEPQGINAVAENDEEFPFLLFSFNASEERIHPNGEATSSLPAGSAGPRRHTGCGCQRGRNTQQNRA